VAHSGGVVGAVGAEGVLSDGVGVGKGEKLKGRSE